MPSSAVTPSFEAAPFEVQLAQIEALVADGGDPRPLLAAAGRAPDAEPLARLLDALAARGRLREVQGELEATLERLPEAALQHLVSRESTPEVATLLEAQVEAALHRWPLERLSALAFAARWLRRRRPDAYARVVARAEAVLDGPPSEDAARWLLFAPGRVLAALAHDPSWSALVTSTARAAIDVLAHAPKSISQANAERLLAQRVYADPGHFFFELLQNADDAGATRWSACVEPDRVVVRHDGAPFSFLDLIGVLSIGQTTKRADQIGFFGVGFKSVYEICERPRIRSGAFAFEIAHVSIPRALGPAPGEEPSSPAETLLVLPYARSLDVHALHARALAVPPETLTTLPHLGALSVRGPDGALAEWREDRERAAAGERVVLHDEASGRARIYRTAAREVRYEGPREEGKARACEVRVAVALRADGGPTPIAGATLYAFLPTAERTGLRAMVHARFDVTLDRERLELGSSWNEALLGVAGEALADLLIALADEGHDVLPALEARSERAPSVVPLATARTARLRDAPLLRAARGDRIAPRAARLTTPALARALAEVDLGGGTLALSPLEPRERSVAEELGARSFGPAELVELLDTTLELGALPPAWLGPDVLEALAGAPVADARLATLPILVDGAGRLTSAEHAELAPAAWTALYAGERPLVAREAFLALPTALASRLSLRAFEPHTLVADLRAPRSREQLLTREAALFAVLGELDEASFVTLDDVPLVPTRSGRRAAARATYVLDAALAPLAGALALQLPLALMEPALPFAHRLRRFGPSELAALLEADEHALDVPARDALEPVLDALAPTLGRRLLARLGALPLARDVHGDRRPLLGAGRALRAEARPPVPEWPWLARPDAPFVEAVDPPPLDARDLARALAGDAGLPPIPSARLADAQTWLAAHAGELPGALVERLAQAPVWLDAEGAPRALDALRRGVPSSEALDALYAATGARHVAHESTLRFAEALGLAHRLPPTDHAALVADLARGLDPPSALVGPALEEAARVLRPDALEPLVTLPLFADEAGTRRPLGRWRAPDASRAHRAGPYRALLARGPWPLVASDEEARFATLLALVGPAPATAADVVAQAGGLLADPAGLLAFVRDHAAALEPPALAALAALPLFPSGAGVRHESAALASRALLVEVLGPRRLEALELEDALLDPEVEPLVAQLALPTRAVAALIQERVLPALVEGEPLDAQPEPWRRTDDLIALTRLVAAAGLPLDAPLAVEARGRLVRGPCWTASAATRALIASLPLADRLADAEWAATLSAALGDSSLLAPLPPRRVAEALREACPAEAPRERHPVVRDPAALFTWLVEVRDALLTDEVLRGALGGAAVLPSQRGTLRAPRDLVLDADLPDLELGWGLAPDVPLEVAGMLRRAFELDRRARRALVEHVLDGVDAAARVDDAERGADLLAFLARALGAADASAAELEERARRLDVRARLRVPVEHAHGRSWDKPRFAWAPSDGIAAEAPRFALDLPPRIASPRDPPSQRLLAACGARDDLDDAAVIACLDGAIRPGDEARRALARYVASRALVVPGRVERWRLGARAWVPARDGTPRRPSELVWPDPLAHALFGEDAALFPDRAVVEDLPEDAVSRLGFRDAATLGLDEVARRVTEARPELLRWLEDGLASERFAAPEVRAALRETLRLRDDEGVPRAVPELARAGARALFGARRGDFSAWRELPRLSRALGIPPEPDAAMIAAYLVEIGSELGAEAIEGERDRLAAQLPECLARLAEGATPLPLDAALAGLQGERVVLTRVGDPAVRLLSPAALADVLDDGALGRWIDPLPTERSEALEALLLAAGAPDLWSLFEVRGAVPGPGREALDPEAEALRASLAPVLQAVGKRARVVESLAVRGVLGAPSGGYRDMAREEHVVPVDAAVVEGTLWLTPRALREPPLLAPALERDPARRAALARWLGERRPEVAPPRPAAKAEASPRVEPTRLFDRMKRWLGGGESSGPKPPPPPAPRPRASPPAARARDEGFFRPRADIDAQLERTDGWLDARREAPRYGFAFTPSSLGPPWLYAHALVATRFDRRSQRWDPVRLPLPASRGDAGSLLLRGTLPSGDNLLPVPLFGRVLDVRIDGEAPALGHDPRLVRLRDAAEVRVRVALGEPPELERARVAVLPAALERTVPDEELPDAVHDALASLDPGLPPVERALALRDFVRERYRYDPTYLEDPAIGRWLARLTQGRSNVHVAALHAGADGRHLGAGVCYELNVLACELLRRAGIPCAIATGWVLSGGQLSEPDHLWALALLEDERGEPLWLPIDASTTRDGRPLRVPRRPPGRFRPPPAEPRSRPPEAPRWERLRTAREPGGPSGERTHAARKRRPPRAELSKVLYHLERLAGEPLGPERRAELEQALTDRASAEALLRRLRGE